MTDPQKRRSLDSAPHRIEAQKQKPHANLTRLTREIAAILAIGLMVGTMFWSAVFGMASDLASGPMVPVHVAEVIDDH